jgi:hypothetical protein
MKLAFIFFLSAVAVLAMTSCVVPGDVAYGPGYGSGSVSYRQYNSLPTGYVGSAYLYNGTYYSGGSYENGSYYNQGRSYNNRYLYDGRYYYGGSHQHYGSRPSSPRSGYDRNSRTHISTPVPFNSRPPSSRTPHSFR